MYVYCAYTATSYIQFFFTKFTHKKAKTLDILVEIPIGYPQRVTWISDGTRGRRGRDRMLVGCTTTYAISAFHK